MNYKSNLDIKKYIKYLKEEDIYNIWIKKGYFYSVPNKKPSYTIIIPPPNVTGVLHMGHILNNTIQDLFIRKARMQGYNICWLPGTDHASIATETKIVSLLKRENKFKHLLSRKYFLERAWEWTYKQEYFILNQLQKLGYSCDWKKTSFTLDKERVYSVTNCFIELYKRGLIYRDYKLVNWDTNIKTTISNEEVVYKEYEISLYFIKCFMINIKKNDIIITTTRPETIFGDTGICIHPKNNKYNLFINKQIIIPIINRVVPIIEDEYVDNSFGTGILKITPAHDINDAILAKINYLEFIDIFNENGTFNNNGKNYLGRDSLKSRKEIVSKFHKKGILVKKETYHNKIATSERSNSIIETRRSIQWFLTTSAIAKPAITAVIKGDILFHPKNFNNIYLYWMNNIQDWNISRQLWWGHNMPVYYYKRRCKKYIIAKTKADAISFLKKKMKHMQKIIQEEDVLDTWFSSWIWPISTLYGFCTIKKKNLLFYYPIKDLITGPDILYFWVARMIMAGYAFLKKKPFYNIYFTGIVRDFEGKKMSKSIGNFPDTVKLIKKYGSDGIRIGLLLKSNAGSDLFFKEELCSYGRNFSNKLWNAYYLIYTLKLNNFIETPYYLYLLIEWFTNYLSNNIYYINYNIKRYNLYKALNMLYKLMWKYLCSIFLENLKSKKIISIFILAKAFLFFEDILILLHPYMPYITDYIWRIIKNSTHTDSILMENWPFILNKNYKSEYNIYTEKIIYHIRNIRTNYKISQINPILIYTTRFIKYNLALAIKLANISYIYIVNNKPLNYNFSFMIDYQKYFLFFYLEHKKYVRRKNIKDIQKQILYIFNIKDILNKINFILCAPQIIIDIERKKFTNIFNKIKLIIYNI